MMTNPIASSVVLRIKGGMFGQGFSAACKETQRIAARIKGTTDPRRFPNQLGTNGGAKEVTARAIVIFSRFTNWCSRRILSQVSASKRYVLLSSARTNDTIRKLKRFGGGHSSYA
jgi:hypothetical protein